MACVCKAILSNMLNAFGNSQSPSGPSYTTVLLSLQLSDKDHFYFFLRSLGMYLNTSPQPPNLLPSCLIVDTPIIVLKELCSFPQGLRTPRMPREGRCIKRGPFGSGMLSAPSFSVGIISLTGCLAGPSLIRKSHLRDAKIMIIPYA